MATTKNIQSVERTFAILEAFQATDRAELSLRELADYLSLNKSTVFGLVNTLVNLGYLRRDEHSQQYSLGYRFLTFADTIKSRNLLLATVHPFLAELSARYEETVHCAVVENDKAIYLDKVTAPQSISIHSEIGRVNWMHCTGVGKCLLAFLPAREAERILSGDLPSFTDHTLTDPDEIRLELQKIRQDGFAMDREEIELGLCCAAVPVFDRNGDLCCAVSISGLMPRIKMDVDRGMIEDLKNVALQIQKKL